MNRRIKTSLACLLLLALLIGLPGMALPARAADSSGSCGDNLTWSYQQGSGTLTISGAGAMLNWTSNGAVPWYAFAGSIKQLSLPEGLTTIGANAFYGCAGLTTAAVPDSVTSIGRYAFQYCTALTSATLGKGVVRVEDGVFRDCTALTRVSVQNPNCDFVLSSTTLGDPAKTTIVGIPGSTAEQYAKQFGYRFEELSGQFTDVPATAYYAVPVAWAVANGITSGTSKTTFSPGAACTRAQVVTFLWRAQGQPEPAQTGNPFADVAPSAYYYKAVLWAVEKGVTSGTSKTTFSPNQGCTRAQVVTFLWRAQGQPEPAQTGNPFVDVASSAYYYKAVLWAVEKGVTSGTSKTTFSPNTVCTRAQVVTFLYRLHEAIANSVSDWVPADQMPQGAEVVQTKWTYTLREYTQSDKETYPGWTRYDAKITSWGPWSAWQDSQIAAAEGREVRTQNVVTRYNMITYCVTGPNGRSYVKDLGSYMLRQQHGPYWWSKAELDAARTFAEGAYFDYGYNVAGYCLGPGTAYCKWDGSDTGGYVPMYIQSQTEKTQWSSRSAVYTYSYYRDVAKESTEDPTGKQDVSNIQRWVRYRMR